MPTSLVTAMSFELTILIDMNVAKRRARNATSDRVRSDRLLRIRSATYSAIQGIIRLKKHRWIFDGTQLEVDARDS